MVFVVLRTTKWLLTMAESDWEVCGYIWDGPQTKNEGRSMCFLWYRHLYIVLHVISTLLWFEVDASPTTLNHKNITSLNKMFTLFALLNKFNRIMRCTCVKQLYLFMVNLVRCRYLLMKYLPCIRAFVLPYWRFSHVSVNTVYIYLYLSNNALYFTANCQPES